MLLESDTLSFFLFCQRLVDCIVVSLFLVFLFFLNVYLFILREGKRQRVSRGGSDRKERENPNQALTVRAEPNAGLKLMNREIITRAEIKSQMFN